MPGGGFRRSEPGRADHHRPPRIACGPAAVRGPSGHRRQAGSRRYAVDLRRASRRGEDAGDHARRRAAGPVRAAVVHDLRRAAGHHAQREGHRHRPIVINTWESIHMDMDEGKPCELADDAHDLGVEMLVIDDG
ncbi:MAG: alpha-galactosidase [Bifidobacterium scardovii]|nr:alpha-galactosidase [Bifidobacterium scardovii]